MRKKRNKHRESACRERADFLAHTREFSVLKQIISLFTKLG